MPRLDKWSTEHHRLCCDVARLTIRTVVLLTRRQSPWARLPRDVLFLICERIHRGCEPRSKHLVDVERYAKWLHCVWQGGMGARSEPEREAADLIVDRMRDYGEFTGRECHEFLRDYFERALTRFPERTREGCLGALSDFPVVNDDYARRYPNSWTLEQVCDVLSVAFDVSRRGARDMLSDKPYGTWLFRRTRRPHRRCFAISYSLGEGDVTLTMFGNKCVVNNRAIPVMDLYNDLAQRKYEKWSGRLYHQIVKPRK